MSRRTLFTAIAEAEQAWRWWWDLWQREPDHASYWRAMERKR